MKSNLKMRPGASGRALVAAVLLFSASSVYAAPPLPWQEYVARAEAETGWSKEEIATILQHAHYQPKVLELMSRPAERTLTWGEYQANVVTNQRVEEGKRFIEAHAQALNRAEREYGVSKEVIAAIIGIESRYGTVRGGFRVLDALGTLGFHHPTRGTFFQAELTAFLKLAREGHVNPFTLKGSYAGAIGWPQFMPSSLTKLATDFDADGKIDLYDSPTDAIGSVARYFKENGWVPGQAPVTRMSQAKGSDLTLAGNTGPEHFELKHNFEVIKRYNRSNLYAMAVVELSARLGG